MLKKPEFLKCVNEEGTVRREFALMAERGTADVPLCGGFLPPKTLRGWEREGLNAQGKVETILKEESYMKRSEYALSFVLTSQPKEIQS